MGFDLSSAAFSWLAAAGVLLLVAGGISTVRKMLGRFSRKTLLEGLPERERGSLEDLFPRVDDYELTLRVIEHTFRLFFIVSLAFGTVFRFRGTVGPWAEVGGFLAFVGAVAALFVLVLDLGPGIVARLGSARAVRALLPVLDRIYAALSPVGRLYGSAVRSAARALGGAEDRTVADVAEEEILSAVEEGERKGFLKQGEISMIESIIRFRDRDVSEVMTPSTDMICIDIEEKVEDAVRTAIECGHSRIPVYRENKDNIAGILYVKDLLRFWSQRPAAGVRLADIVRQPHFIPESKKIGELFREFQSQRFHIAIILDEFGGTSGLVTIEDIIEEIVGEIRDEFEKEEPPGFQRLGADLAEIDARLPIREVNERLDAAIPEGDGYDTVGGFLFCAMGKVPSIGDSFRHGRIRFEVIDADERTIRRLRVRIESPAGTGEAKEI